MSWSYDWCYDWCRWAFGVVFKAIEHMAGMKLSISELLSFHSTCSGCYS